MNDIAVVPVKGLEDGKKRLASYLGPNERRKLIQAMLHDVLSALHRSRRFAQILVISPDESIAHHTGRYEADFVRQNGTGLNSAVQQAVHTSLNKEATSITAVLADLPMLQPRDVEELTHISAVSPRLVLAPSLKGGTNVMLRAPPDVIKTSYGRWSYARHLRSAQEKGLATYTISNSRLSFDVDTIEDVRNLRQLDSLERTNAGRVARELGRLHPIVKST